MNTELSATRKPSAVTAEVETDGSGERKSDDCRDDSIAGVTDGAQAGPGTIESPEPMRSHRSMNASDS
jgi:hypothetical protein